MSLSRKCEHFLLPQFIFQVSVAYNRSPQYERSLKDTILLEKYHLIFCKNLVDFIEVPLHEVNLNLHTQALIFFRLSIASVDDKQHLREVVFSALVGFSLLGKYPTFRWGTARTHKNVYIKRIRSLANCRSLVFLPKKSQSSRFHHPHYIR